MNKKSLVIIMTTLFFVLSMGCENQDSEPDQLISEPSNSAIIQENQSKDQENRIIDTTSNNSATSILPDPIPPILPEEIISPPLPDELMAPILPENIVQPAIPSVLPEKLINPLLPPTFPED